MKDSIQAYIEHEVGRRRFNILYSFGYLIVLLLAVNNLANLSIVIPLFLFHAFTNIIYLSTSPGIQASNKEIINAGKSGPSWFKKRINILTGE